MPEASILVLGAGPAGAATALGLRRMGYPVTVVSDWRRFAAVEGVSQRVLEGLRHAGLGAALAEATTPATRQVHWNGERLQPNQECLLDRQRFDQALRDDLRRAGVELVEGRVREVERGQGYRIHLDDGRTLHGEFLVEARGRQAPLSEGRLRGPETVSLLNLWQAAPGTPVSAVESLDDGWAWMARLADGRCYWQVTLDATTAQLPGKTALPEYCAERRRGSALVAQLFGERAFAPAQVHARSSTAILAGNCAGPDWLRVGDAAMAVDPLSGNGIFQSLSSALQAPVVINTLLQRPGQADLAQRFHQTRVEQLFLRFARIGRDFYAQETQRVAQPFWARRRGWPDAQPLHAAADWQAVRVERRPVLREGWVEEAEVVVTADQPLGVWHLQGVELAPVVRGLQAGIGLERLVKKAHQPMVERWLREQGH
ncbi:flavin-dependent monooxygenase QhpG [Pseudomonas mosselii]|uniref:FAD-dependent monooxygenase n=1 Tax=Pseudomonas mosselii TaxID=78327 RepID=A0ABX9B868_9PSED|nr:FAD-dependent monooxygenase [Pseudomonas mosselii]MBH3309613.1 FAD-dependent monooxygenase [Pseudomonas mosselii]MBH3325711.1 FAD-dependent monooxygenase [Pseudomonas mosselii]MCL8302721.1 FAD-dependent monooxygenase [Pseudomonas mosselii]MCL8341955.1 FAD-dependent monooxygenase [Pseudomonas mosselii]MDH0630318.1 FAD-dependent monooxygenase [Pseudomonas mosselii]